MIQGYLTMKKPKQVNKRSQKHQNDWFNDVLDENKKLAIPIGPRFQADVAEWTGPPQRKYPHKSLTKSTSSKYLGTVIWSNKETTPETEIGKGRPENCDCHSPGAISCVKRHIALKRTRLQKDLGPAFHKWKFDEMGEAVAKLWKYSEQQKFIQIVKRNPISEGNNFIKLALESFQSKSWKNIASYYFNVYLPRRISAKTRSRTGTVDTDDDEEEEEKEKKTKPCSKGSRKRAQVDGVGKGNTSKIGKVGYLSGRR